LVSKSDRNRRGEPAFGIRHPDPKPGPAVNVRVERNCMSALRRMFGPSRKEIWRQLSDEIAGRYVEGTFWKGDKVEATHDEWIVTLDTFAVSTGKVVIVFTRMRAPYVNPGGFRFTVYRKGVFSGLGKKLGMQDIEIGDEEFDRDFIIKATDESRVRELMSNKRIRDLIALQPDLKFSVRDDEGWFGPRFPDGVDELSFVVGGVVTDIQRLKRMYELFSETLDELCRIGAAYKHAPDLAV
jgi:hypothetical protein